jgi:hypothetical protein
MSEHYPHHDDEDAAHLEYEDDAEKDRSGCTALRWT